MFTRALIVLLLVLNVGVATWWAMRKPSPPPVPVQPQGVVPLQLLSEAPSRRFARPLPTAPADAAVAGPPAASGNDSAAVIADAAQCVSFGPFATADAAARAQTRLQPLAIRIAAREQFATPPRGWRVYLPPHASPEVAQAAAQRISAAGFSDLLVLHDGADANAIALGRYRDEDMARRRAAALGAAGFAAKAEPVGEVHAATWLDIVAGAGFDAARAQAAAAAPQRRTLDCARLQ